MEKNKNDPLFRTCGIGAIETRQAENNSRQIELSLSSEAPYERFFGTEILLHEPEAIDLMRLQELGTMLFNHNPNAVIGKILAVELDEEAKKLRATVEFDKDEEAEKIYQKVLSRTLKGVSVGYMVEEWEDVREGKTSSNGRFTGPCSIATKWTPYELSIVSVPADPTVGVGRSLEIGVEKDMENHENLTPQSEEKGIDLAKEREAAIQLERQRVAEITAMCRQFGIEAENYIKDGTTVEAARAAIMDKLAAERTAQTVTVEADEMDKFRAAAVDGLALRAGIAIKDPAAGASDFRGKRMLRLAAECIERETGKATGRMDDETLVREALTGTGAFPGILSNVANKSMAQSYQTAPTTYQLWTASGSVSDFKKATRYRLSEADELEKLTEQGEFKNGTLTESSIVVSIDTYGKGFGISRKAIINDDLGALNDIPARHGAAARRMINKMVYKILTDNPTIEGAALFHSNHKNLQAVDISVEGLGTMKAAMARQKNIGGKEALNIQPAFLLCPPELEVTAAQLINSTVDPTKANATVNPFANKLTVISDPELTDTKAFYLVAAPGYAPTIEVTSLNGNLTPTIESAVQFDVLGIKWRIYMDVGVNLVDYRGIQKSSGKQ
ncbi:MAG: HK97 family phage prohead protease [Selenomonadaceae bacterium]|nr:HK97 family phage prohead protease [Selenomonadaceae bacterium]